MMLTNEGFEQVLKASAEDGAAREHEHQLEEL
jgi:hypothetical protein